MGFNFYNLPAIKGVKLNELLNVQWLVLIGSAVRADYVLKTAGIANFG